MSPKISFAIHVRRIELSSGMWILKHIMRVIMIPSNLIERTPTHVANLSKVFRMPIIPKILYPPFFHYRMGYSQYILNTLNLSAYLTLITSMSHASDILFVCLAHVLNQYLHEMPLKSYYTKLACCKVFQWLKKTWST